MLNDEERTRAAALLLQLRALTRDHETAVLTLIEDGSTIDWLVEAADLLAAALADPRDVDDER